MTEEQQHPELMHWISAADAATLVGVGVSWLYRNKHHIQHAQIGSVWVFDRESVLAWARNRPKPGGPRPRRRRDSNE